jgi:hypothetical protein
VSELQLALLAVAALVLLALYISGKWQQRRLMRRLRDRLHGGVGDALLRAGSSGRQHEAPVPHHARADPRSAGARIDLDGGLGPARASGLPGETGVAAFAAEADSDGVDIALEAESGRERSEVTSEPLPMPSALLRPNWIEDPLLDCSLELRCTRAVDGVSVIDAVTVLAHSTWKLPVHFVVWDGRHQQWVLPDRFGYYTDALASIQLADRRGRIEEDEVLRFVHVVQQIAATLDADVDAPDPQRLLAQAQELDRLCARFDIRIGLTVEAAGVPWTGPQIRHAAQQAAFVAVAGAPGQRWVKTDSQGDTLYTLQGDPASMDRLTLELDIAVAPVAAGAFRSMVESATTLAAALGGRVVDDNGDPIDPRSMDAVEAQLARVYEDMRAAGIEPGSARARRLYV